MPDTPILEARGLKMYFPVKRGFRKALLKAVDEVSFTIGKGETLGLVGESGCGKSTVARMVTRLYAPTGGQLFFDGADITRADMTPYRRRIQMVFQDPYASLDARMTVREIVEEPLRAQFPRMTKRERGERAVEQLKLVGLNTEHMNRFPHEFSGGQRQRVSIARALILNPDLLVCDEPISALDVSIQAQVVNMLLDLREKMGLSYLFIAHDLSVVRHMSDRVAVMYLGRMMECARADDLYGHPLHPYTQFLLAAVPVLDPAQNRARGRTLLSGDVPSPVDPPPGCPFAGRCPRASDICRRETPALRDLGGGHMASCHLLQKEGNA